MVPRKIEWFVPKTEKLSGLPPKRDCNPKTVNNCVYCCTLLIVVVVIVDCRGCYSSSSTRQAVSTRH